ncbi:uncharacterized protein FIBRA_00260 [Fibroporia radiculosa]|uniref:N-acetyltransferase domain-containing protein n=1 Tax=Fibroporia radiculosa TaxID=599839 RepID=J7SBZ5_9APHY|nr:uncharacterized protein FIBRA_00260 [Fibroporia radiculosa]CCL98266.1 predicted protein [Fibroporia radiculosa]
MSALRIVQFNEPQDFIEAASQYDTYSMNFTLGSLLDYTDSIQAATQTHRDRPTKVLLAVYRGNELLLSLTKHAEAFAWMMASPSHVDTSCAQDGADLLLAAQMLANYLSSITDPNLVDKVIGPELAVDTFIKAWVAHMQSKGVHLTALEPSVKGWVLCATRASLPPWSTPSSHNQVSLASSQEDIAALAPLYVEFSRNGTHPQTLEVAQNVIREAVDKGKVWAYRSGDAVAGYILVGRVTPRTVAIRNVFVLPDHRRKGIAETMVHTVTRYYLGVAPSTHKGNSSTAPKEGIKEEICLNVSDPAAMKIYKRCGFMLDDVRDPHTERKRSFRSLWGGVERAQ